MTADLIARLAAAGVRVKPLEWTLTPGGMWQANGGHTGSYLVGDRQWWGTGRTEWVWIDGGDESAKSAAQADYTARILAALEVADTQEKE